MSRTVPVRTVQSSAAAITPTYAMGAIQRAGCSGAITQCSTKPANPPPPGWPATHPSPTAPRLAEPRDPAGTGLPRAPPPVDRLRDRVQHEAEDRRRPTDDRDPPV